MTTVVFSNINFFLVHFQLQLQHLPHNYQQNYISAHLLKMIVTQDMIVMIFLLISPLEQILSASNFIIPKKMIKRLNNNTFFSTISILWCVNLLTRVSSIAEYFYLLLLYCCVLSSSFSTCKYKQFLV